MNVLVSVVIPVFNRKELLLSLIKSIINQSYRFLEIIVIDDCSTENIIEEVQKNYPVVKIARCRRRFGPAFAKNLGGLKARGKYILFFDSDIEIINKDMIKNMVEIAEHNNMIGQVGGLWAIKNGSYYGCGENISLDGKSLVKAILLSEDNKEKIYNCEYIPTSNCFIERKKFFEVGGFDPYYIYGSEDKDFGYRIKKKGYINCFAMHTLINHTISDIAGCKTRFYDYYRVKFRFLLKHSGIHMLLLSPCFDFMRKAIRILGSIESRIINQKKIRSTQVWSRLSRSRFQRGNLAVAYLKAVYWNIQMLRNTIDSSKINNLSAQHISKFVRYAERVKLFEEEVFY